MTSTLRRICNPNGVISNTTNQKHLFNAAGITYRRAYLHGSSKLQSLSPLRMPALSPTMESGQISNWNFKPGDHFSAGDILLTVETDKASVEVEAQDDGYMGPQLFGPGSDSNVTKIQVGQLIAVLGEEAAEVQGEVEIPEQWTESSQAADSSPKQTSDDRKQKEDGELPKPEHKSQSATRKPKTNLPLSPAVSRLLTEHGIDDATKIKGSGLHGRLTKGDVLAFLGKASSPSGTAQKMIKADSEAHLKERSALNSGSLSEPQEKTKILSGPELRRLIADGLHGITHRSTTPLQETRPDPSFERILGDYGFKSTSKNSNHTSNISNRPKDSFSDFLSSL